MIRTTIIPDNTDVYLSIPEDYLGRKIEVMYYPVDELVVEKTPVTKMAEFRGILTGKTKKGLLLKDYHWTLIIKNLSPGILYSVLFTLL